MRREKENEREKLVRERKSEQLKKLSKLSSPVCSSSSKKENHLCSNIIIIFIFIIFWMKNYSIGKLTCLEKTVGMLWKFFINHQQPRKQYDTTSTATALAATIPYHYYQFLKKKQKTKELIKLIITSCFDNEKWHIRRTTSRGTRIRIN